MGKQLQGLDVNEKDMARVEAIVLSMTPRERSMPHLIDGSRRKRIAAGSGTTIQQVNQLLSARKQMQKMMKQMKKGKMPGLPQELLEQASDEQLRRYEHTREEGEMAVRMRLTRVGSKKNPVYRVVVADSRSPRDGKFIEIVGRYNPQTDPSTIDFDEDKVKEWLAKGATPSNTVARLLKKANVGG